MAASIAAKCNNRLYGELNGVEDGRIFGQFNNYYKNIPFEKINNIFNAFFRSRAKQNIVNMILNS
jgi:hypothetical protein